MSKMRITFYVSKDVVERVKNAAYWTPGMTLSAMAEKALEEHVERLEAERGEPFPERESELSKGRPVK